MRIIIALMSILIFSASNPKVDRPVCLAASQARIFPLGATANGLIVVETRLGRGENFGEGDYDEMEPYWRGICYLKVYDKNHNETASQILDTLKLVKEELLQTQIEAVFAKGMTAARRYNGFKPAKPLAMTFADYKEKCSMARILFDTVHNKIGVQLKNKTNYPITVLFKANSIASHLLSAYGVTADSTAIALKGNLGISSVRQFAVNGKKITVVHLGTGTGFGADGQEYKPKFAFNDIDKSVFLEPVLHHGNGFDYVIWEQ
jgi:hypothetical protein